MFLLLILPNICIATILTQVELSQEENYYTMTPFYGVGIVSRYNPLGSRYYQYNKIGHDIQYFLGSIKDSRTNELFYFYYLEISMIKQKIIHHTLLKSDDIWNDIKEEFDFNNYEGQFIYSMILYDTDQALILILTQKNKKYSQQKLSYKKLLQGEIILLSGGSYNGLNPMTGDNVNFKIFPGKIETIISSSLEEFYTNYDYEGLYQCSDRYKILEEKIDISIQNDYQMYTLSKVNTFYYKLTFWVKIDQGQFDQEQDQEINVIRISANRFTMDFQETGSNSFIMQYIYKEQNQQWTIFIEYYTYDAPIIQQYYDITDPFRRKDEISILNSSCIFNWQFIIIEYDQNQLNFLYQNFLGDCEYKRSYYGIYQFSYILYRLFFGGSYIDTSSLDLSIATISFYDCKIDNQICHFSCETCFGPLSNQCLTCSDVSNRIFNQQYNTCSCKIWYEEYNQLSCYYFPYDIDQTILSYNLKPIEENISENYSHQCEFGEFIYTEQCFQCPSASQINSISCSECLKNSLNWIFEGARCSEVYYKDQTISQNYLQSSNNEINNQFIFQYNEIIPCNGCVLCQKGQKDCYLSNLQHLNQETYIKCEESYIYKNGECIIDISFIKLIEQCPQNCLKCKDDQCLICNTNYFLTYNGQCQVCQISRCQYCFQYNLYNVKQNSIFQEEQINEEFSDNYVTGCLLCDKYFYYSFEQGKCLKQNQNVGCQYYENEEGIKICYSTVLNNISNKLQQIEDCQNYLPYCKICVHYSDNLLACIQCDQGFYIQISNGSCKSCNYDNKQHIQECSVDSINQDNYKLNFIGNYQTLTQHYFDIKGLLQQLNVFKIEKCQQYYQIDLKQNICNSNCQYCEDCQLINNKYQCLLCSGQDDSGSVSFSQINGVCYKCPTSCSMCYPSTPEQIAYYNPYYIFDPLNPPLRCIRKIDQLQTYIDFESGQIYPIDQSNQKKSYFSINANDPIVYNSDILKKAPSLNLYYTTEHENQFLSKIYSLKFFNFQIQTTKLHYNNLQQNISNFNCSDCLYYNQEYELNSTFGVAVQITNIQIQKINLQFITLLKISGQTNLEVLNCSYNFSNIQYSTFIFVKSFYRNGQVHLKEIFFLNSNFTNSQLIHIRSDYSNELIIQGLTFKNCIFNNYSLINYFSTQTQNTQVIGLEIVNCTFYNSTFLSFINTNINLQLRNLKITQSIFYDSYFLYSNGQLQIEKIDIDNIYLQNSIILLNFFQDNYQKCIVNNITLNKIKSYSSSILKTTPKNAIEIIRININQLSIKNIVLINSFLFQAYQVSSTIDGVYIYSKQIFPILQFQNCDRISINNLQQFGTEKDDNLEIIEYSSPFIEIENFNYLQISNIQIRNQSQSNNKIFYISSDLQTDVNLFIQNVSIESVFSQIRSQSQNQLIQIMIQSKSSILFQNCQFNSIVFKYNTPTTDSQVSALMFISSPNSQVNLQNLTYSDISVVNSSQSLIKIDANSITLKNLFISQIQTANYYTVNSACGFGYFYAQDFQMIDSVIQNVVSVTFGIIYTQLKLNGNFLVQNCQFDNSFINSELLYVPLYGGVFTIDASFSELNLIVQNTTATNLTVLQSSGFIYLLPSLQNNQITIEQLTLLNIYQYLDSFLSLYFPQNSKENKIILKDIYFKNQYSNIFMNFSKRNNELSFSSSGMQISKSNLIIQNFSIIGYINEPVFTIINCQRINMNKIFIQDIFIVEKITNLLSFISSNLQVSEMSLSNIKTDYEFNAVLNLDGTINKISFDNLKIFNIDFLNCYQGLIKTNSLKFIKIRNFILYKNQCGKQPCLIIQNTSFSLQKSQLISNNGSNLSLILVQDSNFQIKISTLKNNYVQGYAGAIYIDNSNFTVDQTNIINNSAIQSGGLYFVKQKLQNHYIKQLYFRENTASLGLENIWELPDMLALSLYGLVTKTQRNTVGNYIIDSPSYLINQNQQRINSSFIKVSSGQTLQELTIFNKTNMQYSESQISIQLYLYTQLGERVIDNSLSNCTVQQIYVEYQKNYSLFELLNSQSNINITQISFDVITSSMQLGNLIYYLNPYQNKEDYILTSIQCDFMNNKDYYFTFSIKTLKCQIGEYFNEGQCLKCDTEKGFYAVAINSTECLKMDPQIIKSVTKSNIELQQGYWRLSYYQSKIEQCSQSENCLGGEFVSDYSCEVGHIGAICAECDLYNIRGEAQYISNFNNECERKEIKASILLLLIIQILCLFLIAFYISKWKYDMILVYRNLKCQTMHYRTLFNCQIEQQSTLIKSFLNFTQVIYLILPKQSSFLNISTIFWIFGYSTKTIMHFVGFFSDQFKFSIQYLELLAAIFTPFVQICIIGLGLVNYKRIFIQKPIYLYFTKISFTFLFVYQLPYITHKLLLNISKRDLSNSFWIEANLAYQFYTPTHIKWLIIFILPNFVLFSILTPLLYWNHLRLQHKKHNFNPKKGIFGYFSTDYHEAYYFWELIQLILRILVISIHSIMIESQTISKQILIASLLFIYYIVISKYNPFIKVKQTNLEKSSLFINCICCGLTAINFIQDSQALQFICEIIIDFLILTILLQYLKNLSLLILKNNENHLSLITKKLLIKFPILAEQFPTLKKFLVLRLRNKKYIYQKFQMIKLQLKNLKLHNQKSLRQSINAINDESQGFIISNLQRSLNLQLMLLSPQQKSFII